MTALQFLPVLAYAIAIAVVLLIATGKPASPSLRWALPAILAVVFLIFSLVTVAQDGLLQFWVNHTTNLAGNQVWFDLVMGITIAYYLIAPRARAVGMALIPWGVAVILTACIALLPMLARLIWLEQRQKDV